MTQKSSGDSGEHLVHVSTALDDNQREKIDDLLVRWNQVQGRLKRAEQITQFATVPAINELRYAGRMLVAALANTRSTQENGIPSINDAIVTASQYVTNAEHDISDALIYFFQKKTDDLNHRYGANTIRKHFDGYDCVLQNLSKARNLIIASRADIYKRKENYQLLVEISDKLADSYFELVDAEVLFGIEVEYFRAKIMLWKTLFTVAVVLAATSIVYIIFRN